MLLEGKITISRISPTNQIVIRLRDTDSGTEFVAVALTPENFAIALTGMGHVECEIQFREGAPIGKVREHKVELVPAPASTEPILKDIEAKTLVSPFEVDGWKAHMADMFNGNRSRTVRCGTDPDERMQEVGFVRYVEKVPQTSPNSGE